MLGAILSIWAVIKGLLGYGAIGAAAGALSYFAGRLIGGGTGFAVSVIVGAAILIGAGNVGYLSGKASSAAQAKIDRLEFQKAKLAKELATERAAKEVQENIATRALSTVEANDAKMAALHKMLSEAEGCGISADELEIINELE